MQRFAYESMGTHWAVTVWDDIPAERFAVLQQRILSDSAVFDATFSRFQPNSVVRRLAQTTGVQQVPADLVTMLRLYERLNRVSGGRVNSLIGFALTDMGYDETYSLTPKDIIRPVPKLSDALRIIDETHIELREPALIDLGALGKGFFVDKIADALEAEGLRHFLVNGSGDVRYRTDGEPLQAGLEHPGDASKVIGVVTMGTGAMCGSAGNRRKWDKYHHTINPLTLDSPSGVLATWVRADRAAVADGLATALFMCEPAELATEFTFECCQLNEAFRCRQSSGFAAQFF